ncbi:hypothetical protein NHX12_010967 [Muraenolepis orangiensis]|uniref:Uncharacterized protein n=1 Tax=Muraenolepis orangiensis TaxID=630683 RepID=A0A9Q0DFB6_9TELE|nr:hypothetical protein NHX12_010967 [Muraenolepis orangiensis]
MKSTSNKTQLLRLLCTYDLTADKILLVNHMDRIVKHEEADVTLISNMLEAARAGAPTIRILSDDTVVFVLLVYWAWKANVESAVQMEKWDGIVHTMSRTTPPSGHWVKNVRVSWECMRCQDVTLSPTPVERARHLR